MTDKQYKDKYNSISVSDAPASVKEAALAKLHDQYYGAPRRAIALMEESKPELKPGELK